MSNFLDQVSNELSSGAENTETVDVQVEKPEETVEPVDKPSEEVSEQPDKTTEETVADPEPDPKPAEETPAEAPTEHKPKDTSQFSKEEKAQFAFKRQMEKQKAKHDAEIAELKNSWSKQFEEFKASMQKPEEPKHREDFESDDEYIDYLVAKKYDAKVAESAKKAEEEANTKREQDELTKQQEEVAAQFNERCRKCFTDDEVYDKFSKNVNKGLANGLAELLDEAPVVRDYVFQNPNGPLILNKILDDRDSFVRIMSKAANPIEATIEMHEMAKELMAAPAPESTQTAPQSGRMPSLGKPGAAPGPSAPNVFDSEQSLLDFMRGRK